MHSTEWEVGDLVKAIFKADFGQVELISSLCGNTNLQVANVKLTWS